jgi:hypothetical protein
MKATPAVTRNYVTKNFQGHVSLGFTSSVCCSGYVNKMFSSIFTKQCSSINNFSKNVILKNQKKYTNTNIGINITLYLALWRTTIYLVLYLYLSWNMLQHTPKNTPIYSTVRRNYVNSVSDIHKLKLRT